MKSIKICIPLTCLLYVSLSAQFTDETAQPVAQAQVEQSNSLNNDIASFYLDLVVYSSHLHKI